MEERSLKSQDREVKAEELGHLSPAEVRRFIRQELWQGKTGDLAKGYVQANLAIIPRDYAYDFLVFCQRNPKPCPVLEVTDPGRYQLSYLASEADIRTDLPRYRVFEKGVCTAWVPNVSTYWNDSLVTFLLGCSNSFHQPLVEAGVHFRGPSVFVTAIPCKPAGIFSGPLVVTMRPIKRNQVSRAIKVTSRFPFAHGAPIHVGDGAQIGIADISRPDFGQSLTIGKDEVPVFWACGVTTQMAITNSKIPFAITHAPGHLFIGDFRSEELASL